MKEKKVVIKHTGEIGIQSVRFDYNLDGVTGGKTGFTLDAQAVYCLGTMPDPVLHHLGAICREVRYRGIAGFLGETEKPSP